MYTFRTYKSGASIKGGWQWQVTKEVGPMEAIVARSGVNYLTENDAIAGFNDMVKWASQRPTPVPQPPATP